MGGLGNSGGLEDFINSIPTAETEKTKTEVKTNGPTVFDETTT
jgi:hypothetical protein